MIVTLAPVFTSMQSAVLLTLFISQSDFGVMCTPIKYRRPSRSIDAVERQQSYYDAICSDRDVLHQPYQQTLKALKKHIFSPKRGFSGGVSSLSSPGSLLAHQTLQTWHMQVVQLKSTQGLSGTAGNVRCLSNPASVNCNTCKWCLHVDSGTYRISSLIISSTDMYIVQLLLSQLDTTPELLKQVYP